MPAPRRVCDAQHRAHVPRGQELTHPAPVIEGDGIRGRPSRSRTDTSRNCRLRRRIATYRFQLPIGKIARRELVSRPFGEERQLDTALLGEHPVGEPVENADARIGSLNPWLERRIGTKPGREVGAPCRQLVDPEIPGDLGNQVEVLRSCASARSGGASRSHVPIPMRASR